MRAMRRNRSRSAVRNAIHVRDSRPSRQFTKRYLGRRANPAGRAYWNLAMSRVRCSSFSPLAGLLSAACSILPRRAAGCLEGVRATALTTRGGGPPHGGPDRRGAARRVDEGRAHPAPRADDATFLRRVYVDIAGTLPPPGSRASSSRIRRPTSARSSWTSCSPLPTTPSTG